MTASKILDPIYIGGTGRCGTTILREMLRRHPNIIGIPAEFRLHIDPHGLVDLLTDLSSRWTPWRSETAYAYFGSLAQQMESDAPGKPYSRYAMDTWFGRFWQDALTYLEGSVVDGYSENTFWAGTDPGRAIFAECKHLYKADVARLYQNFMSTLFEGRAQMVSETFAEASRVTHFVEDTPDNINLFDPLSRLHPDGMYFIHIHRDPYDVLASFRSKRTSTVRWPSGQHRHNALRIQRTLQRALRLRHRRPSHNVLNVKFEDLVADPQEVMANICGYLQVPYVEKCLNPFDPELTHVGRWKTELDDWGQQVAENILGPLRPIYGYD